MEASQQQIPPQIQAIADSLGIDVQELLDRAGRGELQQQPAQEPHPLSDEAPQEQGLPPLPGAEGVQTGADTAEGVRAVPTESREQQIERENAVLRQELQQTRQLAQRADEGRVIGSGGVGPGGQQVDPPNIGSIEPGIRWAYFNGLISDEDIVDKVGPLLADLLKAHQGGAI